MSFPNFTPLGPANPDTEGTTSPADVLAAEEREATKRVEHALKIDAAYREIYRRHLDAFRAGRPWREPAPGVEAPRRNPLQKEHRPRVRPWKKPFSS